VYDYARTRKRWGVRAIKGVGGPAKPIWDKAIRRVRKLRLKHQGQFYAVGTDTTKDKLHECLKVTMPGPKFLHVPARIPKAYPDWFEQITAERKVNYREKGKEIRGWRLITEGRHNEVLDTMVYAIAAAYSVQMGRPGFFDARMTVPVSEKDSSKPIPSISEEPGLPVEIPEKRIWKYNSNMPHTRKREGRHKKGDDFWKERSPKRGRDPW
jgi:phage terminase large subunit GpA-like protein